MLLFQIVPILTSCLGMLIVVLGRPFVKRFALCYQTVVLFLLSICDVGVLWPNGWMGQEETWHRCRPRSTPQTGTQLHTPEKGDTIPNFQPCLLWPKGWMDKDATCYEGRPRPRSHCVRLGPSPPSPQKGAKPPIFGPCIVAKRLDGSRCQLVRREASALVTLC